MAELTIRPDEIRDALAEFVRAYEPAGASAQEVGTVAECGDGIARVEGLPSAMANELLEFEDGTRGLALNLNVREIGVVILGDFSKIDEGQQVRRTGEVLSVPVGDGFLGRVVDPLGEPLDGKGPIENTELRPLEVQAPSVVQRQKVHEPLQSGIKSIDSITPVGRGQRELIIGDRQTGKTAIAIDTIINQKANWESGDPARQVKCVYVAVGQKGSTIAEVRQSLEDAGALQYTTIVAAPASAAEHHLVHDPPGRKCEQTRDYQRQGEDPDHRGTIRRDIVPARLQDGEWNHCEREQREKMDGAPRSPVSDCVDKERTSRDQNHEQGPRPTDGSVRKRSLGGQKLHGAEADRHECKSCVVLDDRRGV